MKARLQTYLSSTGIVIIVALGVLVYVGLIIGIGMWAVNKIQVGKRDYLQYIQTYQKSDNKNDFEYLWNTQAGKIGADKVNITASDLVTFPEITGEYMYVYREREEYHMHTRTYTTTDSKGHTTTHTEVYYSWDYAGSDHKSSSGFTLYGKPYDGITTDMLSNYTIQLHPDKVIKKDVATNWMGFSSVNDTYYYVGSDIRYIYKAIPAKIVSDVMVTHSHSGTKWEKFSDTDINKRKQEAKEDVDEHGVEIVVFIAILLVGIGGPIAWLVYQYNY